MVVVPESAMLPLIFSNVAGPMPLTFCTSSSVAKRPFFAR